MTLNKKTSAKIGGQTYWAQRFSSTKSAAQSYAKQLRTQGHSVRVRQVAGTKHYGVWAR
jgi:hypothetical protein